jgi:hypothetical protein
MLWTIVYQQIKLQETDRLLKRQKLLKLDIRRISNKVWHMKNEDTEFIIQKLARKQLTPIWLH